MTEQQNTLLLQIKKGAARLNRLVARYETSLTAPPETDDWGQRLRAWISSEDALARAQQGGLTIDTIVQHTGLAEPQGRHRRLIGRMMHLAGYIGRRDGNGPISYHRDAPSE